MMRPASSRVYSWLKMGSGVPRRGEGRGLAEGVVGPLIGHAAESGRGEQAVLRVARERQRAGCGEIAVQVVAERDRVEAVD
jgi:hypothetical protein